LASDVLGDAARRALRVRVGLQRKQGCVMDDPFAVIKRLSDEREQADWAWRCEVMNLRAAGFSTRAIAHVAGVSHDTVWRCR
jgi:hypothetical protein